MFVELQRVAVRLPPFLASMVAGCPAAVLMRMADKILVQHNGLIREQGRHEELLEMGGIYHRLHQLQYKGEGPPLAAT